MRASSASERQRLSLGVPLAQLLVAGASPLTWLFAVSMTAQPVRRQCGQARRTVDCRLLVCAIPSPGVAADPSTRVDVRNPRCACVRPSFGPARPACANRRPEIKTPRDRPALRLFFSPRGASGDAAKRDRGESMASVSRAAQMIRGPRERHAPQSLG
jgi:hypothetical protein